MGLRITKWYLDLVDDDGHVVIAYAARVHWRRLRLAYSATLERSAAGDVQERMTLRRFEEPRWVEDATGQRFEWGQRGLGVRGTWTPLRAPSQREAGGEKLLVTDRGDVRWHLLAGGARATWSDDGRGGAAGTKTGLGYVERLDVTLPPWELPIEELRWGRFVGETADAAWIEWRGPHPLRLAWQSGRLLATASPQDYGVQAAPPELGLTLTDPALLRDGRLASTVFRKVPVLGRTLPMRMLDATETKWCSRGSTDAGERGWAIHEVVRWGS